MSATNDNEQNQARQAEKDQDRLPSQADGSRPADAPVPPAGYVPSDSSSAGRPDDPAAMPADGRPRTQQQPGWQGRQEIAAQQPDWPQQAPAQAGQQPQAPGNAQQAPQAGQPFAYHQPVQSDAPQQPDGGDNRQPAGSAPQQLPPATGKELRKQQHRQYWEDPSSGDWRNIGMQDPDHFTPDMVPGYLKAIGFSCGMLFGLIGVLFVWIFNLSAPRVARSELLKWSFFGLLGGLCIDLLLYSTGALSSSMGLVGSSMGSGGGTSSSGGIF